MPRSTYGPRRPPARRASAAALAPAALAPAALAPAATLAAAALAAAAGCRGPEPEAEAAVGFEEAVRPILVAHCGATAGAVCHAGAKPDARLDLLDGDVYARLVQAPATLADLSRVVPGDADASFLVRKLQGTLDGIAPRPGEEIGRRMPAGGRPPLSGDDLGAILAWIRGGAPRRVAAGIPDVSWRAALRTGDPLPVETTAWVTLARMPDGRTVAGVVRLPAEGESAGVGGGLRDARVDLAPFWTALRSGEQWVEVRALARGEVQGGNARLHAEVVIEDEAGRQAAGTLSGERVFLGTFPGTTTVSEDEVGLVSARDAQDTQRVEALGEGLYLSNAAIRELLDRYGLVGQRVPIRMRDALAFDLDWAVAVPGGMPLRAAGQGRFTPLSEQALVGDSRIDAEVAFEVETTAGFLRVAMTLSGEQAASDLAVPPPAPEPPAGEPPALSPVIDSVEPAEGRWGDPITIRGRNFGETQGESVVTFHGIEAVPAFEGTTAVPGNDIVSWSDREIVARVPEGAATADTLFDEERAVGHVIVARGWSERVTLPRDARHGGGSLALRLPQYLDSEPVPFRVLDTAGMIALGGLVARTSTLGNEQLFSDNQLGFPFDGPVDTDGDGEPDLEGGVLGNPEVFGLIVSDIVDQDQGGGCPGCGMPALAGEDAVANLDTGLVGIRQVIDSAGNVRYGTNCELCHAAPHPETGLLVAGLANPFLRIDLIFANSGALADLDRTVPISPSRREQALAWGPGVIDLRFWPPSPHDPVDEARPVPNHTGTIGFTRWLYVGDVDRSPLDAIGRRLARKAIQDGRNVGAILAWGGSQRWVDRVERDLGAVTALGVYLNAVQGRFRRLDNPAVEPARAARGRRVFSRERCDRCHSPHLDRYTSEAIIPLSVIGTDPRLALGDPVYPPAGVADVDYRGYEVLKLVNLFLKEGPDGSGFLHDASLATLDDLFDPRRLDGDYLATGRPARFDEPGGVPGHEFGLDLAPTDKRDLIEFLRSL